MSLAPLAFGQDAPPSQAEKLFEEGKTLVQEEKYDAGCDKLEQSQQLEPAVGTLGLLAYCREMQGRTATAWRRYIEAADMAKAAGDEERERVARERAEALEPKLSRVKLAVSDPVPGLVVLLDGDEVAKSEWEKGVPRDPGTIEVVAKASGHRPWTVQLDLAGDGSTLTIRVPALAPESERADSGAAGQEGSNLVPGLAVGGAGVVLLGVGGYFGMRAMSKNDDSEAHCIDNACDPEGGRLRDDAKSAATVSTITVGLGLVGVGVGAYLLAPELLGRETKPKPSVQFEPALGPGHAALGVRGTF